MNRNQFWILTAGSGLVVFLLLLQAVFAWESRSNEVKAAEVQQTIAQGGQCYTRVRALATRIYQVSQQTQDQALKDLLTRQHVVTPSSAPAESSTSTPAAGSTTHY
jgi:flagellar basal body-associated protein FliL